MQPVEEQKTAADHAGQGNSVKVLLPSGKYAVIREQNGNDDDIMSNPLTSENGDNFNQFLCAIIIETNLTQHGKMTMQDIDSMLIRDKYVLILASRIHSLGESLYFKYDWGEDVGVQKYQENLNRYIWPYGEEEFPFEGMPGYDKWRAKPYLENNEQGVRELQLNSGKQVRWRYITVGKEKALLKVRVEDKTKNLELKMRDLEIYVDGTWMRVDNFSVFSTRDMIEMRNDIHLYDSDFMPMTDIKNPLTGEVVEYPVIGSLDFFYPEEI